MERHAAVTAAVNPRNPQSEQPRSDPRRRWLFPYVPKTGFTCNTRQNDPISIRQQPQPWNKNATTSSAQNHSDANYQFTNETSTEDNDVDDDVFWVRSCNCGETDFGNDVYCPADAYYCIITPISSSSSSRSSASNLVGNYRRRYLDNSEYRVVCAGPYTSVHLQILFPLMLFMFLFFTLALFRSPRGRYCRGYLRRCIGCWDEERYYADLNLRLDRMYERQRVHRMRLQRLRDLENSGRVVFPATILYPGLDPDWRRDSATTNTPPATTTAAATPHHAALDQNHPDTRLAVALPIQPQQIVCLKTKVYQRRCHHHHQQQQQPLPSENDSSYPMAISLSSSSSSSSSSLPVFPKPNENEPTTTRAEMTETVNEQQPPVEEEEDLCTICLLEFREGDAVGDIPCGHMFHKECLKSWIRRRKNHCPLCLRDNMTTVAAPEQVISQQQEQQRMDDCEPDVSPGGEDAQAQASLSQSASSTIELVSYNHSARPVPND